MSEDGEVTWGLKTWDDLLELPNGSVVLDVFAATCTKEYDGWVRVTPAVANGAPRRHLPFLPADLVRRGWDSDERSV